MQDKAKDAAKLAPILGDPNTSHVLGKGGAAMRGQGVPTGYAYRVRRATTRRQRSIAENRPQRLSAFYQILVLVLAPGKFIILHISLAVKFQLKQGATVNVSF